MMRRFAAALLAVVLVVAATAALAEDYVEPAARDLPLNVRALLRWPCCFTVSVPSIDGVPIDTPGSPFAGSGRAVLAPGRHRVVFEATHGGSVAHCGAYTKRRFTLELEPGPGRSYLAKSQKRSRDCRVFLWVEDEASPEILAGAPPPGDPGRLLASLEARSERLLHERFQGTVAAADAGEVDALLQLGIWYLLGDAPLLASDPAAAEPWLERAAAGGAEEAARLLQRITAVDSGRMQP
jgi:hypothetical protein